MFSTLIKACKIKDVRKKIFYILFIIFIYRLGTFIPLPGVDLNKLSQLLNSSGGANSIFAIISGGAYGSIFAMGIAPYITASIIMQLLTVAIPKLEQLQKDGEEGRKKINQYSRVLSVILAIVQSSGTVFSYSRTQIGSLFTHSNLLVYAMAVLSMVTGTLFIIWLSELLTEKGIGNGSSFIIFANILSNLRAGVYSVVAILTGGGNLATNIIVVILLLIIFVSIIGFVVCVQDGERRIPVQYSRKLAGKQVFGGQSSFIPIKVNIAGVMSIIFAISLLQFPQTISQFVKNDYLQKLIEWLSFYRYQDGQILSNQLNYGGILIYAFLIFFFTFFYTSFAINPVEISENLKKSGGFLPGIRQGKPTSDYIQLVIDRVSWIGATFYVLIAVVPLILQGFLNFSAGFGGTTLLIVTGVALEFIKQLESQLLVRHYKGFLS